MPTSVPLTTKNPGDVLTSSLWNAQVKANIDKLLNTGHRTLTVAQFAALTGLEGTKGTVAGDEVYLEADAANGILWHLVYESTETTYKWRYLGGPPMVTEILTDESTASAAFADLATAGPSITVPRGGDYDGAFYVSAYNSSTGASMNIAIKKGAAATSLNDGIAVNEPVAGYVCSIVQFKRLTALAASDVVKVQYSTGAGTLDALRRKLAIRPVRII